MAIWKDTAPVKKETVPAPVAAAEPAPKADLPSVASYDLPRRAPAVREQKEQKESLLAAELTIEGKIEGSGNIRIAGRFKGDVHVQGNVTIDPGAKVTGGVRAGTVTIGGELEGNIDQAGRVELLESGVLIGDLKAGSLIVAAGSRMRGHAEFGWDPKAESGPAA